MIVESLPCEGFFYYYNFGLEDSHQKILQFIHDFIQFILFYLVRIKRTFHFALSNFNINNHLITLIQ